MDNHWFAVLQGVSSILEQHRDTEEDELKVKKQMAQFIAQAVTQVMAITAPYMYITLSLCDNLLMHMQHQNIDNDYST